MIMYFLKVIALFGIILGASLVSVAFVFQGLEVIPNTPLAFFQFIVFLSLFLICYVQAFQAISKRSSKNNLAYWLSVGMFIGVIAAPVYGLSYYFYATIIDPAYTQQTVQKTIQYWQELGYTLQDIKGQVELSPTFRNPALWSFELSKFILIMSVVISFVVGTYFSLRHDIFKFLSYD